MSMENNAVLASILQEFLHLAEIPRPSHHEEQVSAYLLRWAAEHGLSFERDHLGEVIIDKPASPGCEDVPRVILQAHMDMVCVAAEGVSFDPLKDPIQVLNDGKTLTAKGTSLGADDGIGVALCLHILKDDSLRHGPLRAIFTVNEEDGMSSIALPEQYLDAGYLINLDWEWLGSLCNSSAGCDFFTLTRRPSREALSPGSRVVQIRIKGLLGGHSGVDINRGRANALVSLAELLFELRKRGVPFQLLDFHGGQARNAIPSSADAAIAVAEHNIPQALDCLKAAEASWRSCFEGVEEQAAFIIEPGETAEGHAFCQADSDALLSLLLSLPCGVHTISPFIPSLTESSQNLGVLSMTADAVTLECMERSCTAYRAEELLRTSRLVAESFGFSFAGGDHAPAWAVNPRSRLTPLTCRLYQELTGREMVVEPVHGGLECGAFFEKNPSLDMIAIGPSLQDVHTPKEYCDLESVAVTARLIAAVLEQIPLIG